MKQQKAKVPEQVMYNGRWVDKNTFRAFVYSDKGEKLANSYAEYESLVATGTWFPTKPDNEIKHKKAKHGSNS